MSQGSWGGGGPGGGGWGPPGGAPPGGAPPGGYGPPQGGYGPPPGGGYGPPQGGGYGPPQGGGFGPPGYGPQGGPPPGYTPGSGGFGRFLVQAIIGGVIGGILNLIPVINLLRCCFCLTTMAGVAIGLQIYFGSNQHDRLTSSEAAGFGATAGAIAGLITGVVGMLMMMLLGGAAMMSKGLSALPPDVARAVALVAGSGVVQIPISLVVNAGFGALGGFLSMQIFFKNHLAA